MRKLIVGLLLAVLAATSFGCVILSEYITPTEVDKAAVKYAEKAGVIDANSYRGYANLHKARKLGRAVKAAYEIQTLTLDQLRERNELDYGILNEVVTRNTKAGEQREAALFSEKGLISAGLGLAGMGGLGGLLGVMRKRPGDMTPADLEKATAQAGIDLKGKERQMSEIVGAVDVFMKTYDANSEPGGVLRGALRQKTDADTKAAIAVLKVA